MQKNKDNTISRHSEMVALHRCPTTRVQDVRSVLFSKTGQWDSSLLRHFLDPFGDR